MKNQNWLPDLQKKNKKKNENEAEKNFEKKEKKRKFMTSHKSTKLIEYFNARTKSVRW